ncbi:hypothetical protein [Polyangium mundeleinium]|uniref:Uncharacterized protein n=1 Tax=Polyangium mundeleinium TaxID=2995306 RepID=A0ABT5EF55_9BACT|nr:hypothetical protein [Polyangium mundeleinium]MDC0740406.1 hypothetical protein [Polyangium mundeleinium]
MKLSTLRIDEPCHEDWQVMTGDERARRCERCDLHVTNLSELTRTEADRLLSTRPPESRLCVRYAHDRQGNVVTRTTQQERMVAVLSLLAQRRQTEGEA